MTGPSPYDDPATDPHLVVPGRGPAPSLRHPTAPPPATPPAGSGAAPSGPGGGTAHAAAVPPRAGWLLAAGIGALVAVGIGVYGRVHEPAFFAVDVGGFSSGTAAKAWLATLAFVLALVQLGSSLVMYGRIKRITAPPWTGTLHRWSGRIAVIATVPVAIHCLYALGFQSGEPRVLVHSLFGCFFYGVFVAKMLLLQRSAAPRWSLPVFGGAVFTALVALWLTSSLWFFTTSGLTF